MGTKSYAVVRAPFLQAMCWRARAHFSKRTFMQKLSSVLFICCSAGCAADRPAVYAGPLQPLFGTCDSPLRAELSLRGHSALFAPSSGTLILHGQRSGNEVAAQNEELTPEHKSYLVSFTGHVGTSEVEGIYTTPRCRYRVRLYQTQD